MAKGKKTGGRKKGTPNEVTQELRERVLFFLSDNWSLIQSDFKKLEPKDRFIFYERLMSYGLPKLQSVGIANIGNEKELNLPSWFKSAPEPKPTIKLPDGTVIEI